MSDDDNEEDDVSTSQGQLATDESMEATRVRMHAMLDQALEMASQTRR